VLRMADAEVGSHPQTLYHVGEPLFALGVWIDAISFGESAEKGAVNS
jgi:hypothetical protein